MRYRRNERLQRPISAMLGIHGASAYVYTCDICTYAYVLRIYECFFYNRHTHKKERQKEKPPKHLQKIISPWRLERQERHRNRSAFLAESENTAREERRARYLECGV
uniref:Uncharacterized protein n=1 Tax=Mus musculus TaxID=10090 RepID=Q3USU8_MOUSE|nr:unnamed protein product [Mus musculus]